VSTRKLGPISQDSPLPTTLPILSWAREPNGVVCHFCSNEEVSTNTSRLRVGWRNLYSNKRKFEFRRVIADRLCLTTYKSQQFFIWTTINSSKKRSKDFPKQESRTNRSLSSRRHPFIVAYWTSNLNHHERLCHCGRRRPRLQRLRSATSGYENTPCCDHCCRP
jgi:hypothetical protein